LNSAASFAGLIDPADAKTVLDFLDFNFPNLRISHVLYTHKHWDHAGDSKKLRALLAQRKDSPCEPRFVASREDAACIDNQIEEQVETSGEELSFDPSKEISIRAFLSPCHTKGHVLYYLTVPGLAKEQAPILSSESTPLNIY